MGCGHVLRRHQHRVEKGGLPRTARNVVMCPLVSVNEMNHVELHILQVCWTFLNPVSVYKVQYQQYELKLGRTWRVAYRATRFHWSTCVHNKTKPVCLMCWCCDSTWHLAASDYSLCTPTFSHGARHHDCKRQGPQNGYIKSQFRSHVRIDPRWTLFTPSCANPTTHIFPG